MSPLYQRAAHRRPNQRHGFSLRCAQPNTALRRVLGFFAGLLLLVTLAAFAQAPSAAPTLAGYLPGSPLLVLEATDFARLLAEWNGSPEKTLWLDSANYQGFSRSKLFLRLEEARREFATAAGLSPDMALVESVAGKESALAVYDIGSLQFLYVTRLASARALESALWQTRSSFEPRSAAGQPYYVRVDPRSRRVVAFAATDDFLLLATEEDLLAGALGLLAGQPGRAVTGEAWYHEAAQAADAPGQLRLMLNMEALNRTSHFRSYWIQRNVSELRQYRAAVSDIHRSSSEIRDERVFLRHADSAKPPSPVESGAALAQLLRLVPPEAGLYRAWSEPSAQDVTALLGRKILAPQPGPSMAPTVAPRVYLSEGRVGSEAALETYIDQPPPVHVSGGLQSEALLALLRDTRLEAMLEVQQGLSQDSVLVKNRAAVALLAASSWDASQALASLQTAAQGLWTTSQLGATWVQQQTGGQSYYSLDGLTPLFVAARERYLLVANSRALLEVMLGRMTALAGAEAASFAAGLRHGTERPNYERIMSHLDFLQGVAYGPDQQRPPHLFSENLASLSRALARVTSVDVRRQDRGPSVTEVVTYRLSP